MAVSTAREAVERVLPRRMAEHPDWVARIGQRIKVVVSGKGGGTWVVDLRAPPGRVIEGDGQAETTVRTRAEHVVALANGTLDHFAVRKAGAAAVEVEGDPLQAVRLASLVCDA
jgi:hypothetical protein